MLKVWGRKNSSNVAKVMWAIGELGVTAERIDIGGPFGGTRDPAYRALNPAGQIPTLQDDGFALWESNAIIRYLAARYGAGSLLPDGPEACAVADQWMDFASTGIAPAIDAVRSAYRKPDAEKDEDAIRRALAAAAERWSVLEPTLAARPFLLGDRLTMADIACGPLLHRWHLVPLDRPSLPAVSAWYERLLQRDPFLRHVAREVS